MNDLVARIEKLQPSRGDVVLVHLADAEPDANELENLAEVITDIAEKTRATFIILPIGTYLEQLDEREMLARGWLRIGAIGHTTEQLRALG